ncbi:MAG: hypothetical protein H6826_06155 [Planctomycetes bacterium]|nr:hypothetical protein [Planctomycetota bacterium]
MADSPPLHLLVGARADRPDVVAWLEAAEASGRRLRILLTHEGLDALDAPALAAGPNRELALCTRSARDRGLSLDDVPGHVRWTSVATWHLEAGPDALMWSVLP